MNPSELTVQAFEAHVDEDRRRARRSRFVRGVEAASRPEAAEVTIRSAGAADARAIERLAALDSSTALRGEVLLAELAGHAVAAIDVGSGSVVADPFVPTADVVRLLEMRATQLRGRRGSERHRLHLAPVGRTA